MSSTNSGPSVTTTQNIVVQAVPAGGSTSGYDPSSVAITGGRIADLLGGKLRRLAAAAAVSNPISNPPLTAPAAWVAATAYVRGQVATNGGNQYICYTAGTSAGAGGPSGTGAAPITDNTVSWHYYGAPRISANSPIAPAYSVSAGSTPAGLTTLYSPLVNPGVFLFSGGTVTPGNASYPTMAGFPSTQIGTTGGNAGYNNGTWSFGWSVTFETDAPKVAVGTPNQTAPARIIIDGQYLYDGGDSNNSANPVWRVLDFSASGGRKNRRITIEAHGDNYFAGVRVDPQSMVWAPFLDSVKVAVVGSSIEAVANNYPIMGGNSWGHQLGKLLGWSDVRILGKGGTGYLQTNGASGNYASTLSDATSFSPDIVIVGGPINDTTNGYTQTQIQAAALSLFQQIRAALPNALIMAGGNYPGSTGPSASNLAGEAGVLAAVAQFADAATFFIPIANDSNGAWISGTGKVTATTGAGNGDVYISSDGTHLVEFGHAYYARRWAAAIRQKVLPALI